jgi:ankyrin repeat protein
VATIHQSSDGGSRELPPRPSLEFLRKSARERLRELRAGGEAGAKLADAQRAVARDYGFPSWRALKARVDEITLGRLKPVLDAIDADDVEAVRAAVTADASLLTARAEPHGRPLLHVATIAGRAGVVDALLAAGADPGARDRGDNATALHFAAEAGALDTVRRLLDAGADAHVGGDTHGLGVLGWAVCLSGNHRATAELLLSRGARHHIFSAVAMGDAEAVRALIAADPSSSTRTMSRFEAYRTPLHLAVIKRQPEMIDLLLELGADPAVRDRAGATAVQIAVAGRNSAAVDAFARHGIDPPSEAESRTYLSSVTPILPVPDVPAAIAHYTRVLGFAEDWSWGDPTPDFASVSRGDVCIFLAAPDPEPGESADRTPMWLFISVDDVDALHAELAERGADIREAPTDFPWGSREMNVADLAGNRLRFAADRSAVADESSGDAS